VNFGEGNAKKVRRLTARPRHDLPEQFFHRAELLGRDDGEEWEKVVDIVQATRPEDNETITWEFDNRRAFRYYRLLITDGHGGPGRNFASLAELGLYE